jgi:hypothetical protein
MHISVLPYPPAAPKEHIEQQDGVLHLHMPHGCCSRFSPHSLADLACMSACWGAHNSAKACPS